MKNIKLLLILILSAASAHAQDTLTLENALGTAMKNNFSVRIVKNQSEISSNNNTIGNAGMLPNLSADGSYFRRVENVNLEFASGDAQNRQGAQTSTLAAGIQLDYTIFNGFRMFATKDRLEALDQAGLEAYRYQLEATGADVATAYYNIVRYQQQMQVYREAVNLSKRKLELAQTRYEIGSGSKLDYLQAKVELNADSNSLMMQQALLKNATYEMNFLLGSNDTSVFYVKDTITLLPELQPEQLIQQAAQENGRILQARSNARAQLAAIREAKSWYYPQLNISTRYNFNNQQAQAGFVLVNQSQGLNYGVTARWNIFTGWQNRTLVENAKIQAQNASLAEQQITTDILAQLNQAEQTYRTGLQQLRLAKENIEYARENLDVARERYQIGKSNIIEYRQVQLNYIQARIQLLEAAFNTKAAEIQLLLLSGNISRLAGQ